MKISVVTISFNQAHFLKKCIESVLSQNGVDFEYIVVDPGSTDGSREIINSYGDRIIKIYERDAGPADGLNKGFACATGDVFCFINSDDAFLPGAFLKIASVFQSNNKVGIVSGCGYFTDASGRKTKDIVPSRLDPWMYAHGAVTIFQQGTFFKKSLFDATGGFNTLNKTCWDGELFLDMALCGVRHKVINDDVAIFRLHDASITGSGRLNQPYALDVQRLFVKAMGRERRGLDRLIDAIARFAKFLLDPGYVLRKLERAFR